MTFWKRKPTLGELEEELEEKKTQHEIEQEKEAIARLKAQGQRWQDFSTDGTRKGFSLGAAWQWLKSH